LLSLDETRLSSSGNLVLVIDGARRDVLWGLHDTQTGTLRGERIRDRGAAEQLASAIAAQCEAAVISAIIVGLGPGSFTGLRIVLAFAKGLAFARDIPIVGVDSLAAMQHDVAGPERVAVLEAYAGQVFARGPELASDVYDPAVVAPYVARWGGVCDGPVLSLAGVALEDLQARTEPRGLAKLGLARLAAGEHDDPRTIAPNYARASSAELQLGANTAR
jgi:tRNA threonylcarbamoyladenosine biosynthesis protein TsaB